MKLAILLQSYGRFGGAERAAFSHYVRLKNLNVNATLFYSGRLSQAWEERIKNEIRPIPNGLPNSFSGLGRLVKFLVGLRQFDKIVIHHHIEPILALCISKLFGRRTVWYSGSMFELPWQNAITPEVDYRKISPTVSRTSSEFYGQPLSKLLLSNPIYKATIQIARAIDIATVRGFGKIIANSQFLSKFLARTYGLKEMPNVVYPGPDPWLEQIALEPVGNEEDYMLVVGPLIPLKNVQTVIRAAASVSTSKVVLVGDGQERTRLEDLGRELDVPIEFRGTLGGEVDLARAYSHCKILVHLSLYEPFGFTPIEAGLFSKPCIVTNRGGPQETVVDGETGFVVNPKDYARVSSKMKELLGSTDLRHEMGRRARENVLANFSLDASTKSLLAQLE